MATFILDIFLWFGYLQGLFHSFTHTAMAAGYAAFWPDYREQFGVLCLVQDHFDMWTGEDELWLTLHPEPQPHRWNYNVATNIQLVWRNVDCASWQAWVPIPASNEFVAEEAGGMWTTPHASIRELGSSLATTRSITGSGPRGTKLSALTVSKRVGWGGGGGGVG